MGTEVKRLPSDEHSVSRESGSRTTLHQTGPLVAGSFIVDRSENSLVKTTLAWRAWSKNSVPHFTQFWASTRTIRPAWSWSAAYWPSTRAFENKIPADRKMEELPIVGDVSTKCFSQKSVWRCARTTGFSR
jgi:hypothetical protein